MRYLHVVRTPVPTWRDVAPRVKALVKKNFASQEDFAKALCEEAPTVSQWLSGKRNPRVDVAIRAVRLAGGTWADLFDEPSGSPDPRLSPAQDHVSRLRQETEALYRLLSPPSEPLELAAPRIVSLEEVGARKRKSVKPPPANVVRLPIVGERLAAGLGSWPERPEEDLEWLTFREDWTALSYPKDHTRYVMAKLGNESIADSMSPEILPRSLLVLDYSDGARVELVDQKPYLCVVDDRADEPALAVKKVERVFRGREVRGLRLISPNEKRHPPIDVTLEEGQPIQHVIRARVVWWATTVE